MRHATRVTFPRLALLASALTAAGLVACSDAPAGLRSTNGLSASADKGGSNGNQNENENQNQNENQNDNRGKNQDTARIELRISLVRPIAAAPDSNAGGEARFESRRGRMKLNIEAEHLTAGDSVSFFVNNVQVGSQVVGALGQAELELDSQHGQTVPAVVAGATVAVKTKAGATILSGTF